MSDELSSYFVGSVMRLEEYVPQVLRPVPDSRLSLFRSVPTRCLGRIAGMMVGWAGQYQVTDGLRLCKNSGAGPRLDERLYVTSTRWSVVVQQSREGSAGGS